MLKKIMIGFLMSVHLCVASDDSIKDTCSEVKDTRSIINKVKDAAIYCANSFPAQVVGYAACQELIHQFFLTIVCDSKTPHYHLCMFVKERSVILGSYCMNGEITIGALCGVLLQNFRLTLMQLLNCITSMSPAG